MSGEGDFRDGDETLIRRTATGHRSAFDALVERHQAAVFRFARTLASDEAAAEDATQETFLSAWRSAARFRGEARVRTWLFTIARHAVERQQQRRQGEPSEMVPLDEIGRAAGWGSTADRLTDRLAVPQLLERALGALSPADCSLLVLRDLEGLRTSDAAEVLGIPETTLKTRLHRARLRLLSRARQEAAVGR